MPYNHIYREWQWYRNGKTTPQNVSFVDRLKIASDKKYIHTKIVKSGVHIQIPHEQTIHPSLLSCWTIKRERLEQNSGSWNNESGVKVIITKQQVWSDSFLPVTTTLPCHVWMLQTGHTRSKSHDYGLVGAHEWQGPQAQPFERYLLHQHEHQSGSSVLVHWGNQSLLTSAGKHQPVSNQLSTSSWLYTASFTSQFTIDRQRHVTWFIIHIIWLKPCILNSEQIVTQSTVIMTMAWPMTNDNDKCQMSFQWNAWNLTPLHSPLKSPKSKINNNIIVIIIGYLVKSFSMNHLWFGLSSSH